MKGIIYTALWIVWLVLWLGTNTNPEASARALRGLGMHGVRLGGHGWFACGGDWSSTEFQALNASGDAVRGVVCCGLVFKACTVRTE